jgi:hypothetical protein
MHFSRKEPRVSIACSGAIRPGRTDTSIGEVVDLSQHGIGVHVEKFTAPGTLVHIALDPGAFPDLATQGRVPVIAGLVVNCKRAVTPGTRYRAGVYVAQMPEQLRDHIRDAASQSAMVVVRDDAVNTSDPRGREALYQAALARLDTHQPEAAARAAERALAADPDNHRYQAIVHRARAEQALLDGRVADATWEAEKAWACSPRDPRIQVLRDSLRDRS